LLKSGGARRAGKAAKLIDLHERLHFGLRLVRYARS
jgi:hypothetical protein